MSSNGERHRANCNLRMLHGPEYVAEVQQESEWIGTHRFSVDKPLSTIPNVDGLVGKWSALIKDFDQK